MNNIILFFKGFIVGLGKIIPGVSGSLLAFSLGIYEKAIDAINNFFSDIKENILFLGKIGLGVVLAILLCSKLIIFLLNHYYLYTIIFFIGLIGGTVPYILKKVKINKIKDISYILISVLIVVLIGMFKNDSNFNPTNNLLSYVYIIFIGFLDAATMIIPGISGTATYMMLGCYEFVLNIFSNPFENIIFSILFGSGLLLGIFLVSKFIAYMLKNHYQKIYLLIIGFSLSSIFYLFLDIYKYISYSSLIYCSILLLIGFLIGIKLGND